MATAKLRSQRTAFRVVGALSAVGILLTTAACGGSDKPSAAGAPTGTVNILVSSADASDAAFNAVNEAFKAKYPEIKAKITSVPNDTFPATKSAQLTAGSADIIVVKNFREVPDFAKESKSDDVLLAEANGLVDLTNEPFMKNYTQSVLDSQAIGGKQYAIPTGLSYLSGVYYNKTIFAENKIEVPTTWTELQAAIATLKGKDITPFGIGGKDTWPAGLVMLGVAGSQYPTMEAKNDLAKSFWDQSVKLTDAAPLNVLERTQTIFENAQKNFSGAGYDDIPALFANGDFAMVPDGTWNAPTISTAVGSKFEIGYFPLPASDNAADNAYLNGKIELQLGISAASKNIEASKAWVAFFSDPANYKTFADKSGFSPAQPDIPLSDFLNSIEKYTSTFQPAWDQIWIANNKAGEDAVYPFNYPALAPLGSDSAADAAAKAQTAWSAAF